MTTTVFDITKANATQLTERLNTLQQQAADVDTPDADLPKINKEIADIFGAIRNQKKSRNSEILAIQAKLTQFSFTIQEIYGDNAIELFSDSEITEYAKSKGLFNAKAKVENKETKPRKPAEKKVFASDANPVLLTIPRLADDHQRVSDVVIHQGRANEFYTGKSMFAVGSLPKPLLRTKGKDVKETKKNLEKHVADGSKSYAHKDAELTKIAEVVFNFVSKDEPHNEAQAEMQGKA